MPVRNQRFALVVSLALGLLACGPQSSSEDGVGAGGAASFSNNQTGTDGGYYYSLWSNGQGSVNMTLDGSNGYSVSWSNIGDFTAGKGWNPGSGHTISYSGSYSNSGGGAFGIYGWTTNPLVEYYIVEAPGQTGSPAQGQQVGSLTSDGATYTIWKHQQVNQPCITGNTCTFWQYISLRQGARTSGTITIQNHFNAWAQAGLNLGSHNYQIMLTESWNGSGNASAKISVGGGSSSSSSSSGGGSSSSSSSGGGTAPQSVYINAGGAATGSWVADDWFSGGSTYTNSNTIDTSALGSGAPPASAFQSERYGSFSYTIPDRTPGATYNVTLYFAETYVTSAGARVFSVTANGANALSNFDIYAAAGGANKAVARSFDVTASSAGQIVLQFVSGTQNPKVNALAVVPGSGSTSSGGTSSGGTSSGGTSSGGTSSGGTSSGGTSGCKAVSGGQSGNFNTTDAICFTVTGTVNGWGCSNTTGRTVTVNGTAVTCGQLPLPGSSPYTFAFSAGQVTWSSFYWW